MAPERQSILAISVPEAGQVMDVVRSHHLGQAPLPGVPPHITLAYPWMPPEKISQEILSNLAAHFGQFAAFEFTLKLGWFGREALLLVPDDPTPFVRLTESVIRRWPEFPYYAGEYQEIEPHVTLAYGEGPALEELGARVSHMLPVSSRALRVALSVGVPGEMSRLAEFDFTRAGG